MNWIEQVSKHHKEYVKTIESFGEYFYAEDLVQEMYIRLLVKNKESQVIINGQVNRYYIFLTLRSLFIDFYRQKSKVIKVDISEVLSIQQIDELEENEAFNNLMKKIDKETFTWHYYDKLLFDLYKNTDKSMRAISKETNISLRSIFCTLKHCKERIKKNIGEDFEDFINQDYELLK